VSAKLNTARTSESAAPRYTLIRNIHLMNPPNRSRKLYDILLKKKEGDPIPTVEAIGKGIDTPDGPTLIIKGAGLIACRSFVDLHTHTCDPGQIVLEDIRTAGEAAVAGGYGDVLNIPYTPSPWSDTDTLKYLLSNYSYQ
jgi:dihydroorotase